MTFLEVVQMIAIKEMEMPKNCAECPFKANDHVCGLLDCAFSCNHFKERNYNCPLIEIVTCKDCKHLSVTHSCNASRDHRICPDDFYCANAERKDKE